MKDRAGVIEQTDEGYRFEYDPLYMNVPDAKPVSQRWRCCSNKFGGRLQYADVSIVEYYLGGNKGIAHRITVNDEFVGINIYKGSNNLYTAHGLNYLRSWLLMLSFLFADQRKERKKKKKKDADKEACKGSGGC